jgi:hypothetical protein
LTLKVNKLNKTVIATIHHDFGYEYQDILAANGNLLYVDFGMHIDGVIIPSNSKRIYDGLEVSVIFSYSDELVETVKDRAWRWYKRIRQRVKLAIYDGMRQRYDIISETSDSESESSGSGSLISGYYTDSSTDSTESSFDSSSTDDLDNVSPSNLIFSYNAKAGLLVATLTHDLAFTDRKQLSKFPDRRSIVYGPHAEFGFSTPLQNHIMCDGLVVEMHLRYNSKNYNNCVNAAKSWYSQCSLQLRKFLNTLRA